MKTILITVIVQAMASAPEPGKDPPLPFLEVKSQGSQEFGSKEACINAGKGLQFLGGPGFTVLWGCVPYDMAKLEVEKPKAKPQLQLPSPDIGRGSRS